jgi:hypothetical protein
MLCLPAQSGGVPENQQFTGAPSPVLGGHVCPVQVGGSLKISNSQEPPHLSWAVMSAQSKWGGLIKI